jgi:hypothetical protein
VCVRSWRGIDLAIVVNITGCVPYIADVWATHVVGAKGGQKWIG